MIIQRLSQCLPSESPGFLNCCSLPGSSKEVISLLSYWLGVGPDWHWPRGLTWSCGHCWWVGQPLQWVQSGLGPPDSRTLVRKRTWNTFRWRVSSFLSGFLCSSLAKPPVLWLKWTLWLESCRGLQQWCRNQYSGNQASHSERWRTQVYYAGGPRGVNTPSSEPQQRGYRAFIHGQTRWSGSVGLWRLDDCK